MQARPPFEISESREGYGPVLSLDVPWNSAIAELAARAGVRELRLGPEVVDLSFLSDLPDIESLSYLHDGADTKPLHTLRNLRNLYLANVTGPRLDFGAFPKLERCSLEWSSAVSGVFEARGLRNLYVNGLPKAMLPRVANLAELEDLSVFGTGASLDPLRSLQKLSRLRIVRFNKLDDNGFVADLAQLRDITVQGCSGFSSLEPFAGLDKLESLALENVGPVESLRPLANLSNLRLFVLFGSPRTKLEDGDLSPVWGLPKLERFFVRGKNGIDWRSPEAKPSMALDVGQP